MMKAIFRIVTRRSAGNRQFSYSAFVLLLAIAGSAAPASAWGREHFSAWGREHSSAWGREQSSARGREQSSAPGRERSSVSEGLNGKLIVGYQGWFGCPSDYAGNKRWQHWVFQETPDTAPPQSDNLRFDLLPSVRQISMQDLCETKLRRPDGSAIQLYSAQNERIVATHFKWMADHNIDGAAVQRFVGIIENRPDNPQGKERSDHVLTNVRRAAEASGRVFFVTYDISGGRPQKLIAEIRDDWKHLVDDLKITQSPNYLRVNGKPLIELWGFGFDRRPGKPGEVLGLISDLKDGRGGLQAATLIGGVPAAWRTDAAWGRVYRSFDVISPWLVGAFRDDAGADAFFHSRIVEDIEQTKKLGIGYMPVIFPGFSWFNLQNHRGQEKVVNEIPRRCGRFLWHQVSNLLAANVDMLYGAMFDEVDEGTALFPVETRSDKLPVGSRMVSLNMDGCSLPDDWYLRVTGEAANYLHRHEIPPQKLEDVIRP